VSLHDLSVTVGSPDLFRSELIEVGNPSGEGPSTTSSCDFMKVEAEPLPPAPPDRLNKGKKSVHVESPTTDTKVKIECEEPTLLSEPYAASGSSSKQLSAKAAGKLRSINETGSSAEGSHATAAPKAEDFSPAKEIGEPDPVNKPADQGPPPQSTARRRRAEEVSGGLEARVGPIKQQRVFPLLRGKYLDSIFVERPKVCRLRLLSAPCLRSILIGSDGA
jgi:hypothetical protein